MQIDAVAAIQKECHCRNHPYRCSTIAACYILVVLAYILRGTIEDSKIAISRLGFRYLYERIFEARIPKSGTANIRAYMLLSDRPDVASTDLGIPFASQFEILVRLFSGFGAQEEISIPLQPKISAMSSNGIYCYVNVLREPYSSYRESSRIHVGSECIQTTARTYAMMLDQDEDRMLRYNDLVASPKSPMARSLVEENITLRFYYERWDAENFDHRQSANPMACIAIGWDGALGAWRGENTWSPHYPTVYTKGFVLNLDKPKNEIRKTNGGTSEDSPDLSAILSDAPKSSQTMSKGKKRRCGQCGSSDHDRRRCHRNKRDVS